MTDQEEYMSGADGVAAESLGKLDAPQRFANDGKKRLCAVPDCPKTSDGRRSNFMCRAHYTTTSLFRAEVEEERKVRERAAGDDGSDGEGAIGGGDDDDEKGGEGGRRSRRNRKPSAKILRSVETEQVMKKELQRRRKERMGKGGGGGGGGGSKSTIGGGGERTSGRATRIDYSALAGVNDDSSYASVLSYKKAKVDHNEDEEDYVHEGEASSTAGSGVAAEASCPSIPKMHHIIRVAAYPPAPKPVSHPPGPEPSYLFRKGPLPPPSPPIGPQTDPPSFPFQRPLAVNPRERSLADTGIYAKQISLRVQAEADALTIVPLPPRTVGGLRDQVEKTKQCNCKKSGCLKLYCDVSI
jgi:hypothetical protein